MEGPKRDQEGERKRNTSLRNFDRKLLLGFAGCIVCAVVITLASIDEIRILDRSSKVVVNEYAQNLILAGRLGSFSEAYASGARGFLITRDPRFAKKMESAKNEFEESLNALRSGQVFPTEDQYLDAIAIADERYQQSLIPILSARQSGENLAALATQIEDDTQPHRDALKAAVEDFSQYERSRLALAKKEFENTTRWAFILVSLFSALSTAIILSLSFLTRKSFYKLHRELDEALRVREEIVSVVSHDLKNPLAAVELNVALIEKQMMNMPPGELEKRVISLRKSTERMKNLIFSLLDVSKMRAGTFSIEKRMNDPWRAVEEICELMEPIAHQKAVFLEASKSAFVGVAAFDFNRVCQVLSNLIGNAVKFSPPDGTISVAITSREDTILFSVEDCGPGIPQELAEKIFQPYWTTDALQPGSSGLGLVIAKGIVEAHGGKIWVEAARTGGAKFLFTIPNAKKSQIKNQAPRIQSQKSDDHLTV